MPLAGIFATVQIPTYLSPHTSRCDLCKCKNDTYNSAFIECAIIVWVPGWFIHPKNILYIECKALISCFHVMQHSWAVFVQKLLHVVIQSLLRISLLAILPNFKFFVQVIVLKFLPTVRFFHGNVEAGFFQAALNEYEQIFNMVKPLKVKSCRA